MTSCDEAFEAWRLRVAETDILDAAQGFVGAKLKKRIAVRHQALDRGLGKLGGYLAIPPLQSPG